MSDTLKGEVMEILDADSFYLKVADVGTANVDHYGSVERIRISDISEVELQENRSVDRLEALLAGKRVRCFVRAREQGLLVAQVQVF
jgi:hypothetical protein